MRERFPAARLADRLITERRQHLLTHLGERLLIVDEEYPFVTGQQPLLF